MTKNEIIKMIKEYRYLEFGEHKDLKALCTCGESFGYEADFEELVFIVPVDWLIKNVPEEIEDIDDWLQNEYTSDESKEIFDNALLEHKIVMVDFN